MSAEPPQSESRPRRATLPGSSYLSALLIALALLSLVVLARPRAQGGQPPQVPTVVPTPAPVTVYVTGEVRRPGTYMLPPGSRVEDLVHAAGGLTARADPEGVNLAQRLHDELQLNVPAHSQPTSPTALRAARSTPSAARPVNLNTASADELDALPGIGPAKAAAIVEYRRKHGPFRSAAELQEVPGIGPKLWASLKSLVTV
ncbi:MAG: ComEA family DNA-binding protein [Chloroflexota bacterium]|nr:ComEA family DNA-binding protein [Chloroflexota bacterium]